MASRLLPLPVFVVVTVMVSLLALLLQSAAAAVPLIKMVQGSSNNTDNSSSNDNCQYGIIVSPAIPASGTSKFTFGLYDNYGNSIRASGVVSSYHKISFIGGINGPCVNRPCKLVITVNGTTASYSWLMKSVDVFINGGGYHNVDVAFTNVDQQRIGPKYGMELQINNCKSMQQ